MFRICADLTRKKHARPDLPCENPFDILRPPQGYPCVREIVLASVKPRVLASPVHGPMTGPNPNTDFTHNERTERTRSEMPTDAIQCKPLEVAVGDKGIERAIKHLKRKMAAEGILRELKRRRHYMKPSVKRRKKASEAARRRRKRSKMDVVQ